MKNWLAMSAEERKDLIAINVMGWKDDPDHPKLFWSGSIEHSLAFTKSPPNFEILVLAKDDFNPFLSIEDAFSVVEKMREKGFICIVKNRTESNLWDCSFQQYSKIFSAVGTLPEAICIAALRAHGVEVEQREAKDL